MCAAREALRPFGGHRSVSGCGRRCRRCVSPLGSVLRFRLRTSFGIWDLFPVVAHLLGGGTIFGRWSRALPAGWLCARSSGLHASLIPVCLDRPRGRTRGLLEGRTKQRANETQSPLASLTNVLPLEQSRVEGQPPPHKEKSGEPKVASTVLDGSSHSAPEDTRLNSE